MKARRLDREPDLGPREIDVHAPGSVQGGMVFGYAVQGCGDVANGVGVRMRGGESGFVIAYADLERVYLAAKAFRESDEGKVELKRAGWWLKPGGRP